MEGNFSVGSVDYQGMMCEDMRTELSARLDGEEPRLPADVIDAHVVECVACAAWLEGAHRVDAATRDVATPPHDLTESIMEAVATDAMVSAQRARLRAAAEAHGRRQILRLAVAAAAIVQLALALPSLLGDFTGAGGISLHASREMASFDVAVAVGFLLAAYRPQRAVAFVPVAVVLAGCLAVTSGLDLARGVTSVGHEIGHLVAVVQAGLIWSLGRLDRNQRDSRRIIGPVGPASRAPARAVPPVAG